MIKESHHAPGAGSDKQHPNTPPDANERFKDREKDNSNIQDNPEEQNTG